MRRITPSHPEGISLRQAALIAGLGYLINPVAIAENILYPRLVVLGHVEQTPQHTLAHPHLFVAIILSYLINFLGDIVVGWALYVLLAPVNRAVSLLAAWFQLVYTAMGLFGLLNLVTAYRVLNSPDFTALFGAGPLEAQVHLLLRSFRYDWSLGLILFGIHLVLLGGLIYRSTYIPRWIGILLVIDGVAWMVTYLGDYLFPAVNLKYLGIAFFAELVFMFWLLIWGRKIEEPVAA